MVSGRVLRFVQALLPTLLLLRSNGAAAAPGVHEHRGVVPTYYLVVEVPQNGPVEVRHAGVVQMRAPRSLSPEGVQARLSSTGRGEAMVEASVVDPSGHVVHRDVVEVPRWLRAEFPATSGSRSAIDGRLVPFDPAVFVVRLPVVPGGRLLLEGGPLRKRATVALDEVAADSTRALPAHSESELQTAAEDGGDSVNRVDLLILGDGYTAAQEPLFRDHVQRLKDRFFSITPYREYRNYVTVTSLFRPSAQSGADQPPFVPSCTQYSQFQTCCGDASASGSPAVYVDTILDATFCSYNTQRLLTVNPVKVLAASAAVPGWDQILVMVNSPTYGGAGGSFGTFSMHPQAIDVAQHEYGHSFTKLADEYADAYPGFPRCSDLSGPPCEPNVTDATTRAQIKWTRWISPSQPVPSSWPSGTATDAGLWLGARYLTSGMYRQAYSGLMRVLGAPFGDVASEAYALRLYRGGWGEPSLGISPIEPGTTGPDTLRVPIGSPVTVSARILGPVEGPAPEVEWFLDGVPASSGTVPNGGTASYTFTPTVEATHLVRLETTDVSPILHPTVRRSLTKSVTWRIDSFGQILSVSPAAGGTVTSSPAGIDCGTDCREAYAPGTRVTLTPMAAAGFDFTGWGGACAGTGSCILTMDAGKTVTATFTARPVPAQVQATPGATTATITWTTTKPSDSRVLYGTATGAYTSDTGITQTGVTAHSVGLTGLRPSTTYYFVVLSSDGVHPPARSPEQSFTTASATLLSDDFGGTALDGSKWVRGTNPGNRTLVANGQLELRSQGRETGWIVTRQRYVARNTVVGVKVSQPNSDGSIGISPTYTQSSTSGIYGGANNWYRFYTFRSGGNGPYHLYAQWRKNGVVKGRDVTGSLVINGPVYLRLRMDGTRIYFQASLNGATWITTYSEAFSLPGYTLADGFFYELAAYDTTTNGVMRVDAFSVAEASN